MPRLRSSWNAIGILTGLQLDHWAHLDHSDVRAAKGASTTAAWLHGEIPVGLRAARRKVRLAKRIDADTCRLGEAVTAGVVLPEQAEVIAAGASSSTGASSRRPGLPPGRRSVTS